DDGNEVQEKIDNPGDNINAEGLPIVEEQVTLTFMSGRGPTTAEDWNEVGCMKEAEKLTNIHVDFGLAPSAGVGEKRNVALTSGDEPDVICRTCNPARSTAKYGEQGPFVHQKDDIYEYMLNLAAIMSDNPTIRDGLSFPYGHIYSAPQ